MDRLFLLLSLPDQASGPSRSPELHGSDRRTASVLFQQGRLKIKLFQAWQNKKAMKLHVSLLSANKKLGQIAIWVTCRLPWESRDCSHQKPGIFFACKQQTTGNANGAYGLAQAAEVLFTAAVGARKGRPSEVLKSINPKYLMLSHSLVITPSSTLLASFVAAKQQLSPYLHT